MANKRYYWLKLYDDFFSSLRIKKLRKLAGGDTYLAIYLKMQLLAMKSDGILKWSGLEDDFTSELALELDKPVIVHDREAHGDSFDIVSRYPELRGVFHCYSGSAEMAAELLKRGWYLGFDGPITYKNARKALEVLQMCPLERMVIETDSPYLTPVPNGGRRNDSSNLKYVIDKIAEVKGVSASEVERATFENGKKLYGMEDM